VIARERQIPAVFVRAGEPEESATHLHRIAIEQLPGILSFSRTTSRPRSTVTDQALLAEFKKYMTAPWTR